MIFNDHTFAVLAYKESIYLEDCIVSLISQTVKSNIQVFTSTPNEHIKNVCFKYNLNLKINEDGGTIAKDWNYAYKHSQTKFVTLAHQDDIYEKTFCEKKQKQLKNNTLICFNNYSEIKKNQVVRFNIMLIIKSILLIPFFIKNNISNCFFKKSILLFGSPICCPSVTYNKEKLANFEFDTNLKNNLDWNAWYNMANMKGGFIFIKSQIMQHRIHSESETTNSIKENIRLKEDTIMFEKIWGKTISKFIIKFYSLSYQLN